MPRNTLTNALIMKSREECSSRGADLEHHAEKRAQGDFNEGKDSQVRDVKKPKMESPPSLMASVGHYNILQPGEKWTSMKDFPVEVFEGFKLGEDANFYNGLTQGDNTSLCMKGMGQVSSDFVRIANGFGSGGGDEVKNFRTALEQSQKEKADLESYNMTRLQLEQSVKEKAVLGDKLVESYNVTRLQSEQSEKENAILWDKLKAANLRLEEERVLLKAELEILKAREVKLYETHLRLKEEQVLLEAELEKLKQTGDGQ